MLARGVICSYDAGAHAASVSLEGAGATLDGVPALRNVPPEDLAPGQRVLVAVWPDVGAVILGAY